MFPNICSVAFAPEEDLVLIRVACLMRIHPEALRKQLAMAQNCGTIFGAIYGSS